MTTLEYFKTSVAVWRAAVVCESELVKLELEHFRTGLAQFITEAEAACEAEPSWFSVCDYHDASSEITSAYDARARR